MSIGLPARQLPSGTVTFLFTDIEGSTRLIQSLGAGHQQVMERHNELLRRGLGGAGGVEVGERGDGFFYVFTRAAAALLGAAEAQRLLATEPWPPGGKVKVRIGLHTGEGLLGGENYLGLDVNRAARIAAAGHGGQILVSSTCAALARASLPAGWGLRELGSHRLKDLNQPELLFQLTGPGLSGEFAPPRTLGSGPVSLPAQLTPFVGRGRELARVLEELAVTRLLTLTGPGGTGKTRLGLRAAAEAAPSFPDGVHFVPLSGVDDPGLFASAAHSAMGLPPSAREPAEALLDYLKTRRLLLLLDNFEQLLAAGPLVADWLRAAPGLKVLATSRAPLRVYGEREFPVPPLSLPDPSLPPRVDSLAESEAVALFVSRATAVRPDFRLSEQNAAAVAQIVRRLDGLPLALELASARIRLFSPAAILERLDSSLSFLTGGARDLPARQQTLRAAISWSYDLLTPSARSLFRRLSVFAGAAGLEEIEAVCGPASELGAEVLEALTELVDQSLLAQPQGTGEPRFGMLEVIRELARELAASDGELARLQARHEAVYLSLAEKAAPRLTRTGRRAWLDRLEEDHDNLREAAARAVAGGQTDSALRLAGALWRFWQTRGHIREGRQRAAEALEMPGGGERERIGALLASGGMAYWQADMKGAGAAYTQALERARRLGDRSLLALALYDAAFPGIFGGEAEEGRRLLDEALAVSREAGDPAMVGEVLWGIGTALWATGQKPAAEPWFDQALESLAGTDASFIIGWAYRMRGVVRTARGDLQGARADLERSLVMFTDDGDISGVALHLRDFAELALATGDLPHALRLAGAAAGLEAAAETGMLDYAEHQIAGLVEASSRLGRAQAEALLAEGRAMPMRQAIAEALYGRAAP